MKQEIINIIETAGHHSMNSEISSLGLVNHGTTLDKYGINYKLTDADTYYEIYEPQCIQGWIIDISIVPSQFSDFLETVLPLLIQEKVAFKVAKDVVIGTALAGGNLGYILLGKFTRVMLERETF